MKIYAKSKYYIVNCLEVIIFFVKNPYIQIGAKRFWPYVYRNLIPCFDPRNLFPEFGALLMGKCELKKNEMYAFDVFVLWLQATLMQ